VVSADGPRGVGGRSARVLFVGCSSCSYSPFVSICRGFEFWLDEVSDGPRVPGGRSAGAWRTVCVLPADGPFFEVRYLSGTALGVPSNNGGTLT
jgi:hypothetical protein